ncbi:methylmalonyl-CoA mutase family protein [Streptomyces sp. NPDC102441]|uniref:methylmalonyl-CoA mutase family protein n=1 Tax=Streptomyces sp. NPDC102441 TaxID=3366176 RepID=UPI00381FEC17
MTPLQDDGFSLAAGFPEATCEQWQRLVQGVLHKPGRGATGAAAENALSTPPEDTLSTRLEDGLRTPPLYTAGADDIDPGFPGFAPFLRGGRAQVNALDGWDVRQRHEAPDNEAVLTDLENGVTSLWLAVGADGLAVSSLDRVLEGVLLDLAPVVLDAGADTLPAAERLLRLYEERGVDKTAARGNLGADPLGHEARTGEELAFAPLAGLARQCAEEYPGLRAFTVDALPYHEAGGSAVQELGCSLATGVATLRALAGAGLDVEQACAQLEFRYAASADQFLTIAKLRAARRLWAKVAEACGTPQAGGQVQHAVTSSVMMTRRDPWVNMLRTTIAALAAGTGGADSVTVLPFDDALGLPNAFARRIARNTSSVLIKESHLSRVIDPAGGSWYVERLTEELAHRGWEFFQEIEGAGGQAAALRSGLIGKRIDATWSARSDALARRDEPITGVSEFPHLAEEKVSRRPAPDRPGGGLPRVRRDDAFETLRARSDAHLAAAGHRPRIFLAALGPVSAHTARATFAARLFGAGGIEAVTTGTFEESGATEACLCSSDDLYAEQAESAVAELRAAGASHVFLAGRAAPHLTADSYVFAGCDAVAVLSATFDRMGAS